METVDVSSGADCPWLTKVLKGKEVNLIDCDTQNSAALPSHQKFVLYWECVHQGTSKKDAYRAADAGVSMHHGGDRDSSSSFK